MERKTPKRILRKHRFASATGDIPTGSESLWPREDTRPKQNMGWKFLNNLITSTAQVLSSPRTPGTAPGSQPGQVQQARMINWPLIIGGVILAVLILGLVLNKPAKA